MKYINQTRSETQSLRGFVGGKTPAQKKIGAWSLARGWGSDGPHRKRTYKGAPVA